MYKLKEGTHSKHGDAKQNSTDVATTKKEESGELEQPYQSKPGDKADHNDGTYKNSKWQIIFIKYTKIYSL